MRARRDLLCAAFAPLLLAAASVASASPITSIVVYGDSLSDNGNLFARTGQPPPPYFDGRFSNGPVAVEDLAASLAVPLIDFAFGGATTGVGDLADGGTQTTLGVAGIPGMLRQEQLTLAAVTPIAPTSLFVVWGGANDFAVGSASVAAADEVSIVNALLGIGATHILVPGLPDLGRVPSLPFGTPAQATAFTLAFNQALMTSLPTGATYFDTFGLFDNIVANPAAYGLSNVTDSCLNGAVVCANPDQYLFWDDVHPTAAADAIVAEQFANAVAPVPEPATLVLTALGLAGVIARYRRKATSPAGPRVANGYRNA